MTIYQNPEIYAKEAFISLELAKIRCAEYLLLIEQIARAKVCPTCGQSTLAIEGGNYEEGIVTYVYCENDQVLVVDEAGDKVETDCDFTSTLTENYEALQHWYAFDEILALACDIEREGLVAIENQLGTSWLEYAEKRIKKIA